MVKAIHPILPSIWSNPQSLFQYVRAARRNVLEVIPPSSMTQGYTTFPSRLRDTHYVSDRDILREILRRRADDFPKSKVINLVFDPIIEQSIFVTEGAQWRSQHKMIIPVFNHRNVAGFEGTIRNVCQDYFSKNDLTKYNGQDLTLAMQDLTFQVIGEILISDAQNPKLQEIRVFFENFLENAFSLSLYDAFVLSWEWVPNIRPIWFRRMLGKSHRAARALVVERLEAPPPLKSDFLEYLIEAYDLRNTPDESKIREVQDNLLTFIIAGHETTAMTLSWAVYAAGFFPQAQRKIAMEAGQDLGQMEFTESFVKETMRLYPAAPSILRRTIDDENINGLKMKRGEGIIIPIIAIHRHQEYWQNPDRFEPERFIDFEPLPMSYLPFGAGPRVCIGASFAMMEAKIIFSELLKHYRIGTVEHEPMPNQKLTLRSANGIQCEFTAPS